MAFVDDASQHPRHIPNFGYNVAGDDPVVIAIRGEIDLYTAAELSVAFDDLLLAGKRHLVLDLGAVEFIDSSGLYVLKRATAEFQGAGGSLRVSSASHRVRRVVELTGLEALLPLPATSDGMER